VAAGGSGAGGGGAGGLGGAGQAGGAGNAGTAGAAGSLGIAGSGGGGRGGGGGAGGAAGVAGVGGGAGGGFGGATAGAGGSGGTSAAPAWNWIGVIGTGQSLSVGGHGSVAAQPFGNTTQPFHNLKLSLGSAAVPPFDATSPALSMVALIEPIRPVASGYPSAYPANIYGQSYHTAMANQISTLTMIALGHDTVTAHTEVGEAGQPFSVISKGATDTGTTGRAYAASLFEAAAIARLSQKVGKSYGVGAIVLTHGEADAGSATFESDVLAMWTDYNQDLRAATGQTASIPLIQSQQHSVPTTAGSTSPATLAQWQSGLDHPGDIICSGPKYQYPYISDATHLTNPGYQQLGEKYAEVFAQRVILGNMWQPLQPISVERSGRVITVHFHVPSPPLAWDTTLPAPHASAYKEWAQGRGFEVASGGTRVTIASVALSGSDAVQITCASDLPASGTTVAYALTADGTTRANGTVRWGLLRDSDATVGASSGATLPNYCVAFEMSVP
jgi:hypothetical protein